MNTFRKEIKYVIHQATFEKLRSELDHLLQLDPNADILGYQVRSIYFDTFNNKDLYDVLDGSFIKGKVRLRAYGPDASEYKLEFKQKNGDDVVKRLVMLTRDEAFKIVSGDYSVLFNKEDSLAKALYCKLKTEVYKPKLVVSYNRQAYVYPFSNTRISFDTRIKTSADIPSFFMDTIDGINDLGPMMGVLEVKYDDFLLSSVENSPG